MGSGGLSHFIGARHQSGRRTNPSAKRSLTYDWSRSAKAHASKTVEEIEMHYSGDGFYGWKKIGKKTAVPYRIELKPKGLFSIAGLWDEYDDEDAI